MINSSIYERFNARLDAIPSSAAMNTDGGAAWSARLPPSHPRFAAASSAAFGGSDGHGQNLNHGNEHSRLSGTEQLAASALARSAAAQLLLNHRARAASALLHQQQPSASAYHHHCPPQHGWTGPPPEHHRQNLAQLHRALDARRAAAGGGVHGGPDDERLRTAAAAAARVKHELVLAAHAQAQRNREIAAAAAASDERADVLAAAQACLNLAGGGRAAASAALPQKRFNADHCRSAEVTESSDPRRDGWSGTSRGYPLKDVDDCGPSVPPSTKSSPLVRRRDSLERNQRQRPKEVEKTTQDPAAAPANTAPKTTATRKRKKSLPATEDSEDAQPKPKKKGRKKENGMPRRPLSAYNIFFSEERERILTEIPGPDADNSGEESRDGVSAKVVTPSPPAPSAYPTAAHRVLMERRIVPPECKKRRRHRKTHGKISFRDLAKTIGQRWKELPADQMERYQRLAEIDMKRYHEDLELYQRRLRGEVAAA